MILMYRGKKVILVNYEGDVVILVFLMMEYSDIVM